MIAPDSGAVAFVGEGLAALSVDGDRVALDYGGDAANAATMCALLGGNARLVGRVGVDPLGRRLTSFWRSSGVELAAVAIDDTAPTGIYLSEHGSPNFTYWRRDSAGSRWGPDDIEADAVWPGLAALTVTGVTITVSRSCADGAAALVQGARARSIPVVCILNYRPALSPEVSALADLALSSDVLIASEEDLMYTFDTTLATEVLGLMQRPDPELVITAGPRGASVSWDTYAVHQPPPAVSARDSVGAGDALAGAYLFARFTRARPPAEALTWGVAAASLSVPRDGCAGSYPDFEATVRACASLPPAQHLPSARARSTTRR